MVNKESIAYAGLGAGSIIFPNVIVQSLPNMLTSLAPVLQNTLPYCTGVCGACGGTCLGSIGIVAALGIAAKRKQSKG